MIPLPSTIAKKSSTQSVNTIFSSITNIITLKQQNHHIQEKVEREEYHIKRRGWTHKAGEEEPSREDPPREGAIGRGGATKGWRRHTGCRSC